MSGRPDQLSLAREGPTKRTEYMTYAAGLLTDVQSELVSFIIPLWAIVLGFGPLELGILVSAKAILPSVLAIHAGVLMDRFGTRLVMVLMGLGCALVPPFFAVATWFPALLILQMAVGMLSSMTWIGSQALAVDAGKYKPAIVGRFAFFARCGVMVAPLLAGILWDFVSAWFSFLVVGIAGGLFTFAVWALPKPEAGPGERAPFRLGDLMPRLSDYIGAIGLLVLPVVAFVVIVSSVRIASATMQHSFYIVYLKEIGLNATFIGALLTASQMAAAGGALLGAPLTRRFDPMWVFLVAVAASVFFIYSTPIYGDVLLLLGAVIMVRGLAQGLSQPIMYGILSRAVGPDIQATAIGLRSTGNRISNLVVPVFMGAVAEVWGLNATFYVTGVLLLGILGGTGLWVALKNRGTDHRERA